MSILSIFSRHRKTTYSGPMIAFGEAAVSLPLTGRLLIKGTRKGVLNQALDFSYASPATASTTLTPDVVAGIFAQARNNGYHPLSLMEFAGKEIGTGVEVGQPFNPVRYAEKTISIEPSTEGSEECVGKLLYSNERAGVRQYLDLNIRILKGQVVAVTPELVEVIFNRVSEMGITPLDLVAIQTIETEKYVPVFCRQQFKEQPLSQFGNNAGMFLPVPEIPTHITRLSTLSTPIGSVMAEGERELNARMVTIIHKHAGIVVGTTTASNVFYHLACDMGVLPDQLGLTNIVISLESGEGPNFETAVRFIKAYNYSTAVELNSEPTANVGESSPNESDVVVEHTDTPAVFSNPRKKA